MTLVAAQGLCPQEANMCCVLTLQTGLGRSRRITQSPLGWNGEETSKFNQQQVWHPLGKSWLGFDSPALLLKHLAQFSLCRIEIFMCDSMIIYKTKFHLKKKSPKNPENLILWKVLIAVLKRDGGWEVQNPLSWIWRAITWENRYLFSFPCNSSYIACSDSEWITTVCLCACKHLCLYTHRHCPHNCSWEHFIIFSSYLPNIRI